MDTTTLLKNSERFDLKKTFTELNSKIFDGELTAPKLAWFNKKSPVGYVDAIIKKIRDEVESVQIKGLYITDYYILTEEQFKDVFAHELCHLYTFEKMYLERSQHGPYFQLAANIAEGKGYNIDYTVNDFLEPFSKEEMKTPVFVLVAPKNNLMWISKSLKKNR